MRMQGEATARFSVDVQIANHREEVLAEAGHATPESVRRSTVRAVVDSSVTRLVFPQLLADQLGLALEGDAVAKFADGRTVTCPVVAAVRLTCAGRSGVFNAIVAPGQEDVVLGRIVLNALDLVIDETNGKVVPRDPDRVIVEIE